MGELVRKYYETGELKEEYFIFNDKKEGDYKSYQDDGQLNVVCNYINDKKEGEFRCQIGRAHV